MLIRLFNRLVEAYRDWRRREKAFYELSELDDRSLADLGISRAEIRYAVAKIPGDRGARRAEVAADDPPRRLISFDRGRGLGQNDRMAHDHEHGHDHSGHAHGHHHDHHHPLGGGSGAALAFAVGAGLNLGFVAIEAAYGVLGNSIALLSDAGHNLGDALSLGAAWAAAHLAQRAPSGRFTYGLRSSSILVALMNAIILLIAVGAIMLESAERLAAPEPVAGVTVIVVALLGVMVHGATALTLAGGRHDLNVRAAYTHMAADAAVGLGVAAAGVAIFYTGWVRLDPIVSIVVAVVIVLATWSLLRQALAMALQGVPDGIDGARVREHLAHLAGVSAVHDLHIWPMSTTETALTAHLVMPGGHPGDDALALIAGGLHERFRIGHVTLQIETDPEHACVLAPDHVV